MVIPLPFEKTLLDEVNFLGIGIKHLLSKRCLKCQYKRELKIINEKKTLLFFLGFN